MDTVEDPRVTGDICGVTQIGASGIEWICIKATHGKIYIRKTPSHRHHRGEMIFSNNPQVDAHYFVNRWPNRRKGLYHGDEEAEAPAGDGEASAVLG